MLFFQNCRFFIEFLILGSYFPFEILGKCEHFEWLDQYIERIQGEVASSARMAPVKEQFRSGSGNPKEDATVVDADVKAELKKMSKQLREIIELKKKGNLMAGIFYFCVICLGFVYLFIISR